MNAFRISASQFGNFTKKIYQTSIERKTAVCQNVSWQRKTVESVACCIQGRSTRPRRYSEEAEEECAEPVEVSEVEAWARVVEAIEFAQSKKGEVSDLSDCKNSPCDNPRKILWYVFSVPEFNLNEGFNRGRNNQCLLWSFSSPQIWNEV